MHKPEKDDLKINIGCGQSPCAGWLNFDSSPSVLIARTPVSHLICKSLSKLKLLTKDQESFIYFCKENHIRFGDALRGLPLPDSSCSVVYASHVLEHLYRLDEAPRFLTECMRLLKPGGTLRLAVPDLRVYVKRYVQSNNAEAFASALHMVPAQTRSRWIALITGDRTLHRWIYDQRSLSELLRKAGFANICSLEAGQTTLRPTPSGLNLRERAWESLYMEATKP